MTEERRQRNDELPSISNTLRETADRIFSQFPLDGNVLRNIANLLDRQDAGHILIERRGRDEATIPAKPLLLRCDHCSWVGPAEETFDAFDENGCCPQCSHDESALEPYLGPTQPARCGNCNYSIYMDADEGVWRHYSELKVQTHTGCTHATPMLHPSSHIISREEGLRLVAEARQKYFSSY